MRVDNNSGISKVGKGGSARRTSGSGQGFSLEEDAAVSQTAGTSAPASTTAIDAILALQSVEDPLFAQKKSLQRGHSLIDALEEIKADILAGQINTSALVRIKTLLETGKTNTDPQLDALLADIELRARVELAKLGHFPKL